MFTVPVKVRNWQNRFLPPEEHGEDVACDALVDCGAIELALPADVVERLKLVELGPIRASTADGVRKEHRMFGVAELEVQGRTCRVEVIELPRGARPLLGAVPLELMDWHISPAGQRLLPNPESPEGPLLPLY